MPCLQLVSAACCAGLGIQQPGAELPQLAQLCCGRAAGADAVRGHAPDLFQLRTRLLRLLRMDGCRLLSLRAWRALHLVLLPPSYCKSLQAFCKKSIGALLWTSLMQGLVLYGCIEASFSHIF